MVAAVLAEDPAVPVEANAKLQLDHSIEGAIDVNLFVFVKQFFGN